MYILYTHTRTHTLFGSYGSEVVREKYQDEKHKIILSFFFDDFYVHRRLFLVCLQLLVKKKKRNIRKESWTKIENNVNYSVINY